MVTCTAACYCKSYEYYDIFYTPVPNLVVIFSFWNIINTPNQN